VSPPTRVEQSRVTYNIEKRGQVCKLTVLHELEHAPKTAKHVANGWGVVLAGLKTLLETGRPMPMPEPV
jgi:Activator of Hsp90 ATPase homolog 1-like protein